MRHQPGIVFIAFALTAFGRLAAATAELTHSKHQTHTLHEQHQGLLNKVRTSQRPLSLRRQ
jgi:hypothetical protein